MQESYLLSTAKIFDKSRLSTIDYSYDRSKELNMVQESGVMVIAVNSQNLSPTQSKTMAAPGDDDPDHERCY